MPVRHGKARHDTDVFHRRNLRKILGITWKDKITNEEVLQRTGQRRLQDISAERRFRFAGHIVTVPWIGGQEKERKTKEDMADNIQRGLTTT